MASTSAFTLIAAHLFFLSDNVIFLQCTFRLQCDPLSRMRTAVYIFAFFILHRKHSNIGTIFFAVGFSVMMILDVALG